MKILIALLFAVLLACFTVRADTLDISGTTHLVAPGLNENFSTSFLFDTNTLAVSDMVFTDSGTYTGFSFFNEVTFGTPQDHTGLFTGYGFAWNDPNGNQIDVDIPFTLNPTPAGIQFTAFFCQKNCLPGGLLVNGNSPGSSGNIQVSEVNPVPTQPSDTPEPSSLAMLLMGIPVLWFAYRKFTARQSPNDAERVG